MGPTGPRWVHAVWPELSATDLFAALPLSGVAMQDLMRRMKDPRRHYHGLAHLDLMWARHLRYVAGSGLRDADGLPIALAIAFHDAVYESGRSDNEARSAALWLAVSADGAVCGEAERLWVADTILATADHLAASLDPSVPEHRARQWLLDLDLTPLGEAPDVFDANMADLAAEMPDGSPRQRRERLLAVLRGFAAARPLYRSPILGAAFETPAGDNILRHLRPSTKGSAASLVIARQS